MPVDYTNPQAMMSMMGPFLFVGLAFFVLFIVCWWQIFKKAGHNPALSLVFLAGIIPLIGPLICVVFFIWFAFSQWPMQRAATPPPTT